MCRLSQSVLPLQAELVAAFFDLKLGQKVGHDEQAEVDEKAENQVMKAVSRVQLVSALHCAPCLSEHAEEHHIRDISFEKE